MSFVLEADIMSSFSVNSRNDLNTPQNPQIAAALKKDQHFYFNVINNRDSKKANLRFNQFLHVPLINNLTNPRAELTKPAQFSGKGTETTQGTRRFGSVAQTPHDSAGNLDKSTQIFSPEDNFSSPVSSDHQKERWTSSEPHLSSTPMPSAPAFSHVTAAPGGDVSTSSWLASSSTTSASSGPSSNQSRFKTQISDKITLSLNTSADLRPFGKKTSQPHSDQHLQTSHESSNYVPIPACASSWDFSLPQSREPKSQ